jgi:hypothetical protein
MGLIEVWRARRAVQEKTMKMSRVAAVLGCLALGIASLGATCKGQKNVHLAPQPQVDMDPEVLAKFAEEVNEYVALRRKIVSQLTPIPQQATPDQIFAHQMAMKKAIEQARRGAKQGEMFKKSVEAAIRRIIQKEMRGPEGGPMVQDIKQGNPKVEGVPTRQNPQVVVKKDVPLRVNGDYPDSAPFSSMPPSLLMKLPQLPDEVRYRFVGRHLILRDAEANVILDYILDAVPDRSIPR